jgi:YozE SAM-like fold
MSSFATIKQVHEFKRPEPPSWGTMPPDRGLGRFLNLQRERDDAVGSFARQAHSDASFPTDPTTILRYLAVCGAPSEILATAREAVREYRAWWRAGFEDVLRVIADANPERAAQLRERHHEAMKITERLYAEDAQA